MLTKSQTLAAVLDTSFSSASYALLTQAGLADWKAELLVKLQDHAENHYSDGWDVVVECYSVKDVLDVVGSAYTLNTYIKRMGQVVDCRAEQIANCY